jgi:predicted exporter
MGAEANGIVADYTGLAWRWLAYGAVAALVALLLGLRDPLRVARVAGAIAGATLVTVALLTAFGVRFSIINIVALQFVAGVGLDYALFFARRQLDEEERARTLRTLATCNAMAVLTFGLLALCRTPLLRQIGVTVVIGALAAICFGFLFAGPKPGGRPETA